MEQATYAYVLSEQEMDLLISKAAQAAADRCKEVLAKDEQKRKKEENDILYKKTKKILQGYRIGKIKIKDEEKFSADEQAEMRWKFVEDLVGRPDSFDQESERIISDFEKKRRDSQYAIWKVENALFLYENYVENGSEEDKRRLEELKDMYINPAGMKIVEIAEKYGITDKCVYKDIGISTRIMSNFMF